MKVRYLFIVTGLAVASAACVEQQFDRGAEEAAVRAVWDEVAEAFMAKDWERYYPNFSEGPGFQLVHPGQRDWISGSEEFRRRYEGLVTGEGNWTFHTTRFDVRIGPSGDVAWAMAEVVMTANDLPPTTSWQSMVFVKEGRRWKVVSAMAAGVSD